jgi:hypothetical protein
MEIIWGQREQMDSWRRLCNEQKKHIDQLRTTNEQQHNLLMASVDSDLSSCTPPSPQGAYSPLPFDVHRVWDEMESDESPTDHSGHAILADSCSKLF